MFKKVEHTEIVTSNMNRTLDFYTGIIGFKVLWRRKPERPPFDEIAYIELNGTLVEIFAIKNAVPIPSRQWRIGCHRIALEVEDMDKAVKYLKEKGVTISQKPAITGTNNMAEMLDPDGIPIQLVQRNIKAA
ncbi:MAG: VOC family protein [Chloroflexi bacterium]|nr:VOC family protein [Chloroflexota bacterium]